MQMAASMLTKQRVNRNREQPAPRMPFIRIGQFLILIVSPLRKYLSS